MIVMNLIDRTQFWRKVRESTFCRNESSRLEDISEEGLLADRQGRDFKTPAKVGALNLRTKRSQKRCISNSKNVVERRPNEETTAQVPGDKPD